ncbi:MAG: hypothetical protein MO852_03305 [Candidatus Devosia euplotis]|nr:hypothetical protein [Candidatus Devosia euplotis]
MAKSTQSRANGALAAREWGAVAAVATMLPHSRRYHLAMQRFVVLIALVFAIAFLAGMTTAHAHRYFSTPIVVLNHVNSENVAIAAIAPVLPSAPKGDASLAALQPRLMPRPGDRLLRPPRTA